ncbi:membrane-bound acyltransferase YfiQ involved in biofilm formation [Paenibacillus taihuensis]|uniref:Membrane-bound acyltransferase YfiQ involved in biofilm formation n=1 Tax=Paenibacillus taihuensis TaxID=1156355 RepID=A0A3D9QC30_9BACL|nr:acyltransferase family protein [Paenibacillus taihuensis]REE57509.1 membrane-bound acyltransferase YfiQ involved in biofilm formation [Paenibacillus taihuensis]
MKDESKVIKEMFVLRSIACLGIVTFNALDAAFTHFKLSDAARFTWTPAIIETIQMLLLFSTPMFIFISEFILARAYRSGTPSGFLRKRAKYILVPYVTMAILFSFVDLMVEHDNPSLKLYLYELAKNFFLADFFGYFLLVVFQFYLLHLAFDKWMVRRFSMKSVLICTIGLNVLYLAVFNLFDLESLPIGNYYIVSFMNKVPAFAWVAYFSLAFYCGRYYETFAAQLGKRIKWVFALLVLAAAAMEVLYHTGVIERLYSKRFDVLLYTTGMIFILLHFSSKWSRIPTVLVKVSQYSFGIFLLTRFFLFGVSQLFPDQYSLPRLLLFIVLACAVSILGSMGITHVLNKFRFGPFIAGRIGIGIPQQQTKQKVGNETGVKLKEYS